MAIAKKLLPLEEIRLIIVEEKSIQNKELDFKIRIAMDKLPPQCKNVFELCVVDGHKYNSAADSLCVSVNTIKSQKKKAYRILRYNLADVYFFLLFFGLNH